MDLSVDQLGSAELAYQQRFGQAHSGYAVLPKGNEVSSSPSVKDIVDRLCATIKDLGPTDMRDLVVCMELFEQISGWAERESLHRSAEAAASAQELVERIILEDVDDPARSIADICQAADALRGVLIDKKPDDSLSPPAEDKVSTVDLKSEPSTTTDKEFLDLRDDPIFHEFLRNQVSVMQSLEELFLAAENKEDEATLASVRAIIHTLKGEAGLLALPAVETVCHLLEDTLDAVPLGTLVDECLSVTDWFRRTFAWHSGKGDRPESPEKIIRLLREAIGIETEEPSDNSPDTEFSEDGTAIGSGALIDLESYGELIPEFVAEAHEHLHNADVHLLTLESDPTEMDAIHSVFRAFHTIKGVAGFLALTDIGALSHEAENLLDKARNNELTLSEGVIDCVFDAVDRLKSLVDRVSECLIAEEELTPDKTLPKLLRRIRACTTGVTARITDNSAPHEAKANDKLGDILVRTGLCTEDEVKAALDKQNGPADDKKLGEILVGSSLISRAQLEEALHSQSGNEAHPKLGEVLVEIGAIAENDLRKALKRQAQPQQPPKVGELLVSDGNVPAKGVAQALRAQKDAREPRARSAQLGDVVKVDSNRLDILVDAVGELAIAKAMVSASVNLGEASRELVNSNLAHLDKITRELQEIAMSLRMVPIHQTFQKMARLVRDLSKKSGKAVVFEISGEDTELDKSIIDQIADPLVHLVRNAMDHGIEENSEERQRAGKSPEGHVALRAFHRGGSIYIEIEDDGRGLDRDRILAKALERGIVKEGESMSDSQVWNLIFEPGFSTAKKVTEVSGRGVGMDVVRRNVESLRGQIDVKSEQGKGCVISLRLPLTLSIIDGMVIRVGRERLIIPTLSIVVSVHPSAEDFTSVAQKGLLINYQNGLIPVHYLGRILKIESSVVDPEDGILIVLEDDGKKVAFIVDEVIEQQQVVIKSLGKYMGSVPGITGGTIMSDGRVALILDISGLVNDAGGNEGVEHAA